jgi:hypothetical protein
MTAIQRLNQRVKHAAWKWTGTVVDFDFDGNRLSNVTVLRDDTGEQEEVWIPSLVLIKDEEEFDWHDD